MSFRQLLVSLVVGLVSHDLTSLITAVGIELKLGFELREKVLQLCLGQLVLCLDLFIAYLLAPDLEDLLDANWLLESEPALPFAAQLDSVSLRNSFHSRMIRLLDTFAVCSVDILYSTFIKNTLLDQSKFETECLMLISFSILENI